MVSCRINQCNRASLTKAAPLDKVGVAGRPFKIEEAIPSLFNTDYLERSHCRRTYLLGLKLLELKFSYTPERTYTKRVELFVKRGIMYVHSYEQDRFWRKDEHRKPLVRYLDYANLIQKLEPCAIQAGSSQVGDPLGDIDRGPRHMSSAQYFLGMAKKCK
jgi:hypothetical protein